MMHRPRSWVVIPLHTRYCELSTPAGLHPTALYPKRRCHANADIPLVYVTFLSPGASLEHACLGVVRRRESASQAMTIALILGRRPSCRWCIRQAKDCMIRSENSEEHFRSISRNSPCCSLPLLQDSITLSVWKEDMSRRSSVADVGQARQAIVAII